MSEPTITQILTHQISVLQKENKPSDGLRAKDLQKVLDGVREKDKALKEAIGAAEYVVKLVESDYTKGQSPNPNQASKPTAALGHCYAAMAFVTISRKALSL